MKLKRIFCLAMAFVILASVISSYPFTPFVYAASGYNFVRADEKTVSNGRTQSYLTPGTNVPIPVVVNGIPTAGTATLMWKMTDNGEYILEHPISDGVVARFYVEKDSSDYKIRYKMFDASDTMLPVNPSANDYLINTGSGVYVATESFETGRSEYRAERGADNIPVFIVEPGFGLSFRFYDTVNKREIISVSFKTENDGTIRYTTNGIKEGIIYDFSLSFKEGGALKSTEKLSLMTGLIRSSFLSVAKANVDGEVVDFTKTVDLRNGKTADPDNRINISILLPELWNPGLKKFVSISDIYDDYISGGASEALAKTKAKEDYKTLGAAYGKLRTTFSLTNSYGKTYKLRLGDLFNESSPDNLVEPSGVDFTPSGTTQTPYVDPSSGRVYMEIGALEANMFFNRVEIDINSAENDNFSSTTTIIAEDERGMAYTFMEYSLVTIHGKYFVEFQPYLFLDNGVYKGIDGVYYLYDENDREISRTEANSATKDKLMLPTNLGTGAEYNVEYYIEFRPTSKVLVRSQKGKYRTSAQDISIDTPKSFDIVDYKLTIRDVITNPADYENRADLSVDMSWDIADTATLDLLLPNAGDSVTIHYLITNMNMPASYNEQYSSQAAASVDVTVKRIDASAKFEISYAKGDEPAGTNAFELEVVNETDIPLAYASTNKTLRAYVRFKFVASAKDTVPSLIFEYPSINFLNVRPSKIAFGADALKEYSAPASLYESLTLNDVTRLQVPTPQNLKITDNNYTKNPDTVISMRVNWSIPKLQIDSYLDTMPDYPGYEVGSDIYISHSQAALKSIQAELDKLDEPAGKKKYIDENVYVLDCNFTKINDIDISQEKARLGSDEKTIIELLRDGKVVAVRNIPHIMTENIAKSQLFSGLDKNQRYYYTMGLTVTFIKGANTRLEFSTLIGIVGETTLTDPQTPNPLEKFPSAPVFELPIEKGSNNAKLKWTPVVEPAVQGRTIEIGYEIVRIKDAELKTAANAPDNDILNTRLKFEDFYKRVTNDQKIGIELRPDGSYFVIPSSGTAQLPAGFTLSYSADGAPVIMEDNTLIPNNVYFYYVRAYKIIDGDYEQKVYSLWSRVSVTSSPVAAPENLVYERERTDFDKEKEAIISFDAPVFDLTYNQADNTLGGYKFQYQIRLENGDWSAPIDMDAAYLYNNNSVIEKSGYRHYFYKITGLQTGKTYSIRVRLVDANGDASVYTNIAEIRTGLNQSDYDNEILTGDWAAYLKDKLQELVRVNWWSSNVSNDSYVQFRPSNFASILSESKNAGLLLQAPSSNKTEYYIPASSFKLAADGNKSFIIEGNGLKLVVPASVINMNSNEAVLKVNERIKAKAIADYYVKITVTYMTAGTIDGKQALSKIAAISIDLVGSIKTTAAIDEEIYNALVALVAKRTDSDAIKSELKKLIAAGTSNEDLVKYVDKIIAEAKTEFQTSFNKLRLANLKESYSIGAFGKSVQLMYTPSDNKSIVKGYRLSASIWEELELTNSGASKVISANQAGSYVFAGSSVNDINLDGITGAESAIALIIKHGLTDVFVPGMDMTRAATGFEFATVIARMAGAKNTEDPFDFLKSKGISTTGIKSQGEISKQQALYLISCLYEIKTGKKISSVNITNYGLTTGIKNLESKYLKAVQVAYQLGIHTEKTMDAKTSAKVNDMLQMIVNLDKKVKL